MRLTEEESETLMIRFLRAKENEWTAFDPIEVTPKDFADLTSRARRVWPQKKAFGTKLMIQKIELRNWKQFKDDFNRSYLWELMPGVVFFQEFE